MRILLLTGERKREREKDRERSGRRRRKREDAKLKGERMREIKIGMAEEKKRRLRGL